MRIYTRGENQSLLINREITVTVLAVYPDHVRVGISSPRHEPTYWETDLYLPDRADAEAIELELTIN
jgi:carbon storage regulator CsrA